MNVADSEDIAPILEQWREEQEHLSNVRWNLDHVGATGRIDSVVVNALREAGHDVPAVLESLSMSDDWIVDVGTPHDTEPFRLFWKGGTVFASLMLGDGVQWANGWLTFQKSPSLTNAKGKLVREVIPNPIFGDDVRIASVSGDKGGPGSLRCTQDFLHFNWDTGRVWAV